jgi:hypothetical protein
MTKLTTIELDDSSTPEDAWIENEVMGCEFQDARQGNRLRQLLKQMSGKVGATTPLACQDWANTKAAYRFFDNSRGSQANILVGHFAATRSRFGSAGGNRALVLHDTTEFSFTRQDGEKIGILKRYSGTRPFTSCGILMHSSLAVTSEGLPLGLAAIKFCNRQKFHGAIALKRKINPTRIPIDEKGSIRWLENLRQSTDLLNHPDRCVHIGDRESDIYELFCLAQELGTYFLVRTCVDRVAGDGTRTISNEMKSEPVRGLHRIEIRNRAGEPSIAVLQIRYRRMVVHPPEGKRERYPELILTVLHALEIDTPSDRDKIDWKLLTDLTICSRREAIEKLDWYAHRWKIETFHKIMKSGCRA